MATDGHEPLAEELEADADRLETHGQEVQQQIDETRQEWERHRADEGVPGANPPSPEEESEGAEEHEPDS
jgi:hypothetical protein